MVDFDVSPACDKGGEAEGGWGGGWWCLGQSENRVVSGYAQDGRRLLSHTSSSCQACGVLFKCRKRHPLVYRSHFSKMRRVKSGHQKLEKDVYVHTHINNSNFLVRSVREEFIFTPWCLDLTEGKLCTNS